MLPFPYSERVTGFELYPYHSPVVIADQRLFPGRIATPTYLCWFFGACLSLSVLCAGQAFSCFQLSLIFVNLDIVVRGLGVVVIEVFFATRLNLVSDCAQSRCHFAFVGKNCKFVLCFHIPFVFAKIVIFCLSTDCSALKECRLGGHISAVEISHSPTQEIGVVLIPV